MTTDVRESQLVGARDAAGLLGVHVETVRRAAREGSLPVVRLRRRGNLMFRRADFDALIFAATGHPRGAVEPGGAPDGPDGKEGPEGTTDASAAATTGGGGVGQESRP